MPSADRRVTADDIDPARVRALVIELDDARAAHRGTGDVRTERLDVLRELKRRRTEAIEAKGSTEALDAKIAHAEERLADADRAQRASAARVGPLNELVPRLREELSKIGYRDDFTLEITSPRPSVAVTA